MLEIKVFTFSLPHYGSKFFNLNEKAYKCLIKKYKTIHIDEEQYRLYYAGYGFYLAPKKGRRRLIYHDQSKHQFSMILGDLLRYGNIKSQILGTYIDDTEMENIIKNQDKFIEWDYAPEHFKPYS